MEERGILILNGIDGTPGVIRTPDPLLRRQVLYPAELRAHALHQSVADRFLTYSASVTPVCQCRRLCVEVRSPRERECGGRRRSPWRCHMTNR